MAYDAFFPPSAFMSCISLSYTASRILKINLIIASIENLRVQFNPEVWSGLFIDLGKVSSRMTGTVYFIKYRRRCVEKPNPPPKRCTGGSDNSETNKQSNYLQLLYYPDMTLTLCLRRQRYNSAKIHSNEWSCKRISDFVGPLNKWSYTNTGDDIW